MFLLHSRSQAMTKGDIELLRLYPAVPSTTAANFLFFLCECVSMCVDVCPWLYQDKPA